MTWALTSSSASPNWGIPAFSVADLMRKLAFFQTTFGGSITQWSCEAAIPNAQQENLILRWECSRNRKLLCPDWVWLTCTFCNLKPTQIECDNICNGEKLVYLAIRIVNGHQVIDRDLYGFICPLYIQGLPLWDRWPYHTAPYRTMRIMFWPLQICCGVETCKHCFLQMCGSSDRLQSCQEFPDGMRWHQCMTTLTSLDGSGCLWAIVTSIRIVPSSIHLLQTHL